MGLSVLADVWHAACSSRKARSAMTVKEGGEDQFIRALLEAAPDAMVLVDKGGKIALVNVQSEKLFGYLRTELIGQSVESLIPERYRDQHPFHREEFCAEPCVRPMGVG